MRRPLRTVRGAALAAALTTGLAFAQTGTTAPNPPAAGTAAPATNADSSLKEWQVAKTAKVGLSQAITTAEASKYRCGVTPGAAVSHS